MFTLITQRLIWTVKGIIGDIFSEVMYSLKFIFYPISQLVLVTHIFLYSHVSWAHPHFLCATTTKRLQRDQPSRINCQKLSQFFLWIITSFSSHHFFYNVHFLAANNNILLSKLPYILRTEQEMNQLSPVAVVRRCTFIVPFFAKRIVMCFG